MRSLTQNKKGMVGGLAAILLSGSLFIGQSNAASVIAGGEVPLINTLIASGVSGIDPVAAGTDVVLADFWISSNAPGATQWSLAVTLTNGGTFVPLLGAAAGAGASGTQMASAEVTVGTSGTLGTLGATLVAPADQAFTIVPATYLAITATSAPTLTPTGATTNYHMVATGTWLANATLLAGYYAETITATLTAQM